MPLSFARGSIQWPKAYYSSTWPSLSHREEGSWHSFFSPQLHFPIQLWFQHDSFLLHYFSPTTPARQCIGYPELWLFPLPVALPVLGSYPKVISCWHSLANFRLLITKAYFYFFPYCALNVCIPLIHSLKYSSQTHMVFGDEAFGKELRLGEASRWCPQMSLVAL